MHKKKFLVIGGAGYIGSHMVLALEDLGHQVTIFDNFSRGHFRGTDNTNIFEGCLLNLQDIDLCLKSQSFDMVMHFAAFAYVGESVEKPIDYFENNISGTINLLKAMKHNSLNKLVFSSTCAVYGEPTYTPIDEIHPKNPVNPYGKTKLFMEELLCDFSASNDFQSISLRYFNAAGCDSKNRTGECHEPETHLIPLILKQAYQQIHNKNNNTVSLKIFGDNFSTPDGTCVRDYIHVEDICKAHILAATRLLDNASVKAECYNLANDKGFSVLDVIKACSKVTNIDINYLVKERRQGDPEKLVGDAQLAKNILGWAPDFTSIESIIPSAWKWEQVKNKNE
ncbi:UDP-glucose 4-epimerase GalE [Gammaproteobacteria bacterium]|nr:UDP-glucose 4-epimerase GalE [Gammaproteobacteria bacterium]